MVEVNIFAVFINARFKLCTSKTYTIVLNNKKNYIILFFSKKEGLVNVHKQLVRFSTTTTLGTTEL